jgi:DNA-binding response OmpR family regulator
LRNPYELIKPGVEYNLLHGFSSIIRVKGSAMETAKILVIEDEPSIREVVVLYLERAGFKVKSLADGAQALEELEESTPDLVVLDLMLPTVDGYEITRHLRSQGDTPIIMLTARREELDRVAGLEMGADDYVVKPFSPHELVSRVRAVLRRSKRGPGGTKLDVLQFEGLIIDPNSRIVNAGAEDLNLPVKEFDLLYLLASHPMQVFNREQLLDRVWGLSEYIDPSTVTVHIRRIRERIEAQPSDPQWIKTVWGVGYRFEPQGMENGA